ncbi:MAG: HD domain-containing protein [Candidatus Lokiarchaeota archaeon]|nr:HD domain-containing protein [Candidatus Lokiarchaeota archaeon]
MPFVKDALYSYMAIGREFEPLIDSLPVQRLRRIRQLAGTEYVYPGATHTRFEHSLGVMHLAGRLCDSLNANAGDAVVTERDKRAVMSAALLHDIGHGPFSHVFEKLYEARQMNHEDITRWLVAKELAAPIERMGLDPDVVAKLATGQPVEKQRLFLGQIVAGTIDCDSLDYLVRDSYYTGAVVGNLDVQRILLMTRVLDGNLAFDIKIGVPIIEGYFLLRVNSFKQIYFHKTSRAAQIMIANALEAKKEEFSLDALDEPKDFLKWDDYTLWTTIQDEPFIAKLKRREMLKVVYEQVNTSGAPARRLGDAEIKALERRIASGAGVGEKDVFLDVPYLSTVPYAHATSFDPEDIPIFDVSGGGDTTIQKLSDLSVLFSMLKGHHNIIRAYTWAEHRDAVARAARDVLGKEVEE